MIKAALVLEGGSLRGLFTSGVTDTLLRHDLEFEYVNGVSAGAMNGMNYVSRQIERSKRINLNYVHDKRYLSLRKMWKDRMVFNFDFLFGDISQKYDLFDWDTFNDPEKIFEVVATRCKTGEPEYFRKGTDVDIVKAVEASASIPIMSKMIDVDGKKYLDGGVSMPIAYRRAMDLGYDKVVLVLTREAGYRKKPVSALEKRAYKRYFKPLPQMLDTVLSIPERYNQIQEEMEELEKEGKLFIIRPYGPVKVKRLEQDLEKLEDLYNEGVAVTDKLLPELKDYLDI